jgi:hypothetical protein
LDLFSQIVRISSNLPARIPVSGNQAVSSLFPDEQLPAVPLPGKQEMRRRRVLPSGYRRAKRYRTGMINLLHGLFMYQGVTKRGNGIGI